jgi:2-polyprenyl-3-methyl-5-hydroxy-6-metoxy-1,4-benzoquinol methylase
MYEKIRDFWVGGRLVMDVGSSLGVGANILSHEARAVWGVDVNPEAVGFARYTFERPNLSFDVIDVENPPTREIAPFEIITMIEVLEHLEDPDKGIAFIKRFFSPRHKTIAFITVPNSKNESVKVRDDANELHLTHWDAGSFYAYLVKHFQYVTLYAGERLTNFGLEDTIDGSSTCEIVLAKVEGLL